MDERTWSVVRSFQAFMDEVAATPRELPDGSAPPLRETIVAHLGADGVGRPVVRFDVPGHQFVAGAGWPARVPARYAARVGSRCRVGSEARARGTPGLRLRG